MAGNCKEYLFIHKKFTFLDLLHIMIIEEI